MYVCMYVYIYIYYTVFHSFKASIEGSKEGVPSLTRKAQSAVALARREVQERQEPRVRAFNIQ